MSEQTARDIALRARIRDEVLGDLMGSGGITFDRASTEVLLYLPQGFLDSYLKVFYKALSETDGGQDTRGRAGAETGALGRAPGKAPGKAKKSRGAFFIADERFLEIKDRVDKRLRAIGRDMARDYDELMVARVSKIQGGEGVARRREVDADMKAGNRGALREACEGCGRFVDIDWRFCARCGHNLKSD